MSIKERNLHSSLKSIIKNVGIVGEAEKHYICKADGAPAAYWGDGRTQGDHFHNTISAAYTSMVTGRNDVALLSPDSHSQATGLTWAKNMTHLIGAYGIGMQNMRPRIGHSDDFATLLTMSGYGNTLANLYFMHGRGNATNLNLLTDTGGRNSYINCHFGGPMHATEGGTAGYDLIRLGSNELYFKSCFFGIDTIEQTTVNHIEFQASTDPPRSIFEDCVFVMNASGANNRFLKVAAGCGACAIIFKRCLFFNIGGTSLTYGIDGTGLGNAKMFFDMDCSFAGVDDIVAAGYEASVFCGAANAGTATLVDASATVGSVKLGNMLAVNPDVS